MSDWLLLTVRGSLQSIVLLDNDQTVKRENAVRSARQSVYNNMADGWYWQIAVLARYQNGDYVVK